MKSTVRENSDFSMVNKKIKVIKTPKLYKFLNIFLLKNLNNSNSRLKKLFFIDNKKKLINSESKVNKKSKILDPISSQKLFFLLKKNLNSNIKMIEFSKEKKNIVNLLNFQKLNLFGTKVKINDLLVQNKKIKVLNTSVYKPANKIINTNIIKNFFLKKKMSKIKIFRRYPYKINKRNRNLIKKILIKTKLFLNSIFFKSPRKFSISGGPRKRLSRNLRRAFKSTAVEKIVNLI